MLKLAGEEESISTAVQDLISSCRAEPESDSRIESVVEAGESHVSCKMNLVVFAGFELVLHSKLGTHIPCVVEWHRWKLPWLYSLEVAYAVVAEHQSFVSKFRARRLSSSHWAKCMTNSYPRRSPSKRHSKTTAIIRRRPVTCVYRDLGLSPVRPDLGTVTRPSSIYARVNCSVIRDWCTRVQGHPRNLFRRPWIFGLSSLKHHTWPYHASVLWYTEANLSFQMQQRNFPRPYVRNETMDFLFLNDGNLDKCLSKKQIRLATPALWLSSPHWAKCMTKSKFLETACKNYCTHTSAPRHVRVPRSRNFSDCSQTAQFHFFCFRIHFFTLYYYYYYYYYYFYFLFHLFLFLFSSFIPCFCCSCCCCYCFSYFWGESPD